MKRLARWWRQRAGVRVRTALIVAVTVVLAVLVFSALFVLVLHRNLQNDVDYTLEQQAQTLAATVSTSGAKGVDLEARLGDTNVVQLLDSSGAVVQESPELHGQPALTDERPAVGAKVVTSRRLSLDPDAGYRQEALGARDPSGTRYTVVVAQSLEAAEDSERITVGLLLIGGPVVALLVAVVAYTLSGRALQPVERIRRQVAGIDGATLNARIPLPEAEDEVWRLAGTMNLMLDRLESASDAQRQFVSDASHELRSPLTTVRTSIEVALAHPDQVDWPTTAQVVLEEAGRVERIVADLLLLATADERGLQLRRGDVDLDDLVSAEAQRLAVTTGLRISSDVHPARVQGDRDRLARVVRNLADNAARHATSCVRLDLSVSGQQAVLEIADDGAGIPVEDRGRVFERFVRLDDSRARSQGGTGLGLAIVRQLVQAHGGEVAFLDAPVGARVQVTLALGSRNSQALSGTLRP